MKKTPLHQDDKVKYPPIPAAEDHEEFFRLPRMEDLLPEAGINFEAMLTNERISLADRFSMRVRDDRMKAAGLSEGDHVVVQRQKIYADGDIVSVQFGEKFAVRRYFRVLQRIRLETAEVDGRSTIVDHSTPGFAILGKVVQVIRVLD